MFVNRVYLYLDANLIHAYITTCICFSYNYDVNGRLTSVKSGTETTNKRHALTEIQYIYKLPTSQFPQKCILSSGSEFEFLRDMRNEDLFGIVTPQRKRHMFRIIPLIGSKILYHRPPWIDQDHRPYQLSFTDYHENKNGNETLFFPSGSFVKTYNNGLLGCTNSNESNLGDNYYKILIERQGEKTNILSTFSHRIV